MRELTAQEGRVLGALVEKELTTPQGYPLTDSALLAACNQSTSRDPVVGYDTSTVRLAVRALRDEGLVRTVHRTGERSDKHRHELGAGLGLDVPQTALLGLLLLRGPQTLAELRARSERWHPFAGVEGVEQALSGLVDRADPLAVRLERQPGRKEARYAQRLAAGGAGTGSGTESAAVPATPEPGPHEATADAARSADLPARVRRLEDEFSALRATVEDLRATVEDLRAQVRQLAEED